MGWWGDNVPDETLSRDDATSRHPAADCRCSSPYRMRIFVAILVLDGAGRRAARRTAPGEARHRRGPHLERRQGRRRRAEPRGRRLSRARARRLLPRQGRDRPRRPHRRGLPARAAQPPLPSHDESVARLLRDREDRPHRRPHDLRHRRDAGADLAGSRALRAEHLLVLRRRSSSSLVDVVAARAGRARDRAAGVLREPLVPARVEQGLPRRARPHLDEPERRCRRASKACAWCRRSAAQHVVHREVPRARTRTSTKPTWRRSASRRSTSRSSSTRASSAPRSSSGTAAGSSTRRHRHGRNGRRIRAVAAAACSNRSTSSASSTTRCSRPPRR